MYRINTNVASLIAQSHLARTADDLNVRLQRLSTGLRLNRAGDDPAGLTISERLRSQISGLGQAIGNSQRAESVLSAIEANLAEVADLLRGLKALMVQSANGGPPGGVAGGGAGVTQEELDANQMQIDSIIESINRIANTASFAGLKLLNGGLEYQTSGVATSAIAGLAIHAALNPGPDGLGQPRLPVRVDVIASAQTASLFLSGNTAGAAGQLLSSVTVEIAGVLGARTLTFVSGTRLSAVAKAVNLVKGFTGVSAALVDAANETSGLQFHSTGYGSSQFVSVKRVGEGGEFFAVAQQQGGAIATRDHGRDVSAVINGELAQGRGIDVAISTPSLAMQLALTADFATRQGATKSFWITGGGAHFQTGPTVTASEQVGFGVPSISPHHLGGTTVDGVRSYLDSLRSGQANAVSAAPPLGGPERAGHASQIVERAIAEVSLLRGRLGALERYTVQANMRTLQSSLENLTASESLIRDADFATETAALTRAQILTQAGTAVLATANTSMQNVLALLSR